MTTDIQPNITRVDVVDELDWVGSPHGIDSPLSGTLDSAKCRPFAAADGYLPSSFPLALNTESGLYEPAFSADGSTQAAQTLHLLRATKIPAAGSSRNVGTALFWHGVVRTSRIKGIPAGGTFDAAKGARTILYVG